MKGLIRLATAPRGAPVTRSLLWANLAAYALLAAFSASPWEIPAGVLIAWGGNDARLTLAGEPWRLLSAVFLHGGLLHLGLNLLALAHAGRLVEGLYGPGRFAALYLASGALASLASVWWRQDVVSIGASGAIFGVFGALLAALYLRREQLPGDTYRRVGAMVASVVAYSLMLGFAIPGVDNAAHLGGLAAGIAAGAVLLPPRPGRAGTLALLPVVALAVAAWQGIDRPATHSPAIAEFIDRQPLLADRQRELLDGLRRGDVTAGEALAVIDRELKPHWDQLIGVLQAEVEGGAAAEFVALLDYARLERSALEALSLGLSTGHPGWFATAASLRGAANRALQAYAEHWQARSGEAPGRR